MVLVSYSGREINAKLVYYGPGLSGKTTNLEFIYSSIPQGQRGKMVSMKTKTERTLFFDFLPVHLGELSGFKTRFLLYTVPGQVYYNATRKLVLKGVDAVVFVADSKRGKMDENVESLENLKENLKDLGLTLDKLPWVIQYNKRDLSDIYAVEELEAVLNPGFVPAYEAVASTGGGVVETFKGISRLLLRKLAKDVGVPVVGSTVEADSGPSVPQADRAAAFPSPAAPVGPAWASPAPTVPDVPVTMHPAAPVGPAAASPASVVPDAPVTVYAVAPVVPAWAPPAQVVPDVSVTVGATDSSWTAEAGPGAFRLEGEPLAMSEDSSSPSDRETAAAVPRTQFPPVAEPVRIARSGSDDAAVWATRGGGDELSEHRASVGERLRRWLSRSPEPVDANDERPVRATETIGPLPVSDTPTEMHLESARSSHPEPEPHAHEIAEPWPVTAFTTEILSTPTPSSQPEPELSQPVLAFVAAEEPPAEPTMMPTVESAVEPTAAREVATCRVSELQAPPLEAEPCAASQIPIPVMASPEMPTSQRETSTAGIPVPPAAVPPPAVVPSTPPPARATQSPARRRRPREIIVPLELNPDDLAEGVVLKVAIRMQRVSDDAEEEEDRYAA